MVSPIKSKKINLISQLHYSTSRNYLQRMNNNKVKCMKIAKKYGKQYWDGDRKYGYGGYKYIPGRWTPVAKKIIKKYSLNNKSKVLDIGSGKSFLLYEIKKILPKISIKGVDISKYGISKSKPDIKRYLSIHKAQNKFFVKNNYFDLVMSLGCLHNLELFDLYKSIKEIQRIGKNKYIMVESYRNEEELFNLQCWALTCETFLSSKEWAWVLKQCKYSGDYELIYFK
tara:strand:+ start:19349 stop:20029 length:681 start_codon:yes stop_codon:yes gene_type:complete